MYITSILESDGHLGQSDGFIVWGNLQNFMGKTRNEGQDVVQVSSASESTNSSPLALPKRFKRSSTARSFFSSP